VQGAFEDDAALFVALVLLGGKLVDPAELDVALFARHVAHHVAARQHHAVLHLAVAEIDDPVEEEGSSSGSSEARANEFVAVGEDRVTIGAREEAQTANVFQKDAPHGRAFLVRQGRSVRVSGDRPIAVRTYETR